MIDAPAAARRPRADLVEAAPSIVRVRALSKRFRRGDGAVVPAIDDVSLDLGAAEVLVLLGPSGCGKTTLLRAVAGLEHPDSGTIEIAGMTVFSSAANVFLNPEARRLSMIFQSYALWPHMTAFKNIAYPLQARGVAAAEIAARVARVLAMVGIPELAGQYPAQMSGGQQQRVALARAIVAQDKLVLFDEPLSNVDAKVRQQLRLELMEMQRSLAFSAIYVTHDQTEAMALGHRIAVLRAGRIEQIGTAQEIYNAPASRYVASFIGATNEIPARLVHAGPDGACVVECRLGRLAAASGGWASGGWASGGWASGGRAPDGMTPRGMADGDAVCVLIRPEYLRLHDRKPADGVGWPGAVVSSVFLGAYTETVVAVEDLALQVWSGQAGPLSVGAHVWVSPELARIRVVAA